MKTKTARERLKKVHSFSCFNTFAKAFRALKSPTPICVSGSDKASAWQSVTPLCNLLFTLLQCLVDEPIAVKAIVLHWSHEKCTGLKNHASAQSAAGGETKKSWQVNAYRINFDVGSATGTSCQSDNISCSSKNIYIFAMLCAKICTNIKLYQMQL